MDQIIGRDGTVSEPLDINAITVLVQERRLAPDQMMVDPISGQTLPAAQMLEHQVVFPDAQADLPIQNQPAPPTWNQPPPPQSGYTTRQPTYQPAITADTSLFGARFAGYFIDGLCSIPLLIPAMIPLVGILFAPLLALYWMSRDAFFGGQSIGKKAMGIKVVRLDGGPVDWGTSIQRNIIFAPLLLTAIPFAGAIIGSGALGLINIVELVLVLSTGRRIGDNIAKTVVVRA